MAFRIHFDIEPEFVKPKLEDLVIETLSFPAIISLPSEPVSVSTAVPAPSDQEGKGYAWHAWSLNLSLSDWDQLNNILEKNMKLFEVLQRVVEIAVAIIKLIRVFMSDLKSMNRAFKFLIKAIIKQLRILIESFSSTGIYIGTIFPNFDPRNYRFDMPVNGGFREFITRVNMMCASTSDDAPKFYGEGDTVGGVIIGMIGGTNDPKFLTDMIENFTILGKFFRFQNPLPAPPKNFEVKAGFYPDPSLNNQKRLGVRIRWTHPNVPCITGFELYKSTDSSGIYVQVSVYGKNVTLLRLSETPCYKTSVKLGVINYEYIDFKVESGVEYFYQVNSTTGLSNAQEQTMTVSAVGETSWMSHISSPVASPILSAKPISKIPLSELKKYTTIDESGSFVQPRDFGGPWISLTIRALLGREIDFILKQIDDLGDKIIGIAKTSTDHVNEYLDFIEKKINDYVDIINKVQAIIDRIMSLRLRGSFLVLELYPKTGGIMNFVDRFNAASRDPEIKQYPTNATKDINGGIAQFMEKGIMAGVILLYGFAADPTVYYKKYIPSDEIDDFVNSLNKTQTALKGFMKLLGLGGAEEGGSKTYQKAAVASEQG